MMKLTDMFPSRVVRGQDLPERGIPIEITGVREEKMRAGQGKPEETKYVCYFNNIIKGAPTKMPGMRYVDGLGYGFILRKKLAMQIYAATGTDDTEQWTGKKLVIYPCRATAGGEIVMSVCARPMTAGAPPVNSTAAKTTTQEGVTTA